MSNAYQKGRSARPRAQSDIKKCKHCGATFQRPRLDSIPDDSCTRCHETISAISQDKERAASERWGREDMGVSTKQHRYRDAQGDDWIDEFARTATPEEFRGAMRFTVGKYLRRIGKKDAELSEVRKMRDYCQRWEAHLMAHGGEE